MFARLDNLGPFQGFFLPTLSFAKKLWDKNFVTLLEERNLKIRYEFEESGRKKIKICVEEGSCVIIWTSLKEHLEKEIDQSSHKILRRNVVIATQDYYHCVKAFIKEIITHPSDPM